MINIVMNGEPEELDIEFNEVTIGNENFNGLNGNISGIFTDSTKVPDKHKFQLIYEVNDTEEKYHLSDDINNVEGSNEVIVIILESPHYEEYEYGRVEGGSSFSIKKGTKNKIEKIKEINEVFPLEPANGTTGYFMKKWLISILSTIGIPAGSYCIWVVNPIQWQTSLFMLHGGKLTESKYNKLRNQVWKKIWDIPSVRRDFKDRIDIHSPKLILNCCTKELQNILSCFLLNKWVGSDIDIYESYHPSNWNYQERRVIKKIS